MTDTVYYFAYGSNMSSARLGARVSTGRSVGTGALPGHRLEFHLLSRNDDSSKCDAYYTGCDEDVVHGVLFRLQASELPVLDRYEGHGVYYGRAEVEIARPDGSLVRAYTYRALDIETGHRPYDWYKEHVVRGALEHGLPSAYVAVLEAVPAEVDPDTGRRSRELSIYESAGS